MINYIINKHNAWRVMKDMIERPFIFSKRICLLMLLIFSFLVISPLTLAEEGELKGQIINLELKDISCKIILGVVPLPYGQTSFNDYILDDYVEIKGRIVNRCGVKVDSLTLAFVDGHNRIEQDLIWRFNNISGGDYRNFRKIIKNNREMNLDILIMDVFVNGGRRHGNKFLGFNWTVLDLPYDLNNWNRKIDFNTPNPEISESFFISTDYQVNKIILGYPNPYSEDNTKNFIFINDCKINGDPCRTHQEYPPDNTLIEIHFKKQKLNNSFIQLSYNIEKSLEYLNEDLFPFDRIQSNLILFPSIIKVGNNSDLINIIYTEKINFKIVEPNGFIFDKKESAILTGILNNSCDFLPHVLPSENDDEELSFILKAYVKEQIRPPQIDLVNLNGVIIYTGDLDRCNYLKNLGLVFKRGPIYFILLALLIFISILFILSSFIKTNSLGTLKSYLTVVVIAFLGQFLVFPRPYEVTIIETIFMVSIIILSINAFRDYYKKKKETSQQNI